MAMSQFIKPKFKDMYTELFRDPAQLSQSFNWIATTK